MRSGNQSGPAALNVDRFKFIAHIGYQLITVIQNSWCFSVACLEVSMKGIWLVW
jgi:hypothetical protein